MPQAYFFLISAETPRNAAGEIGRRTQRPRSAEKDRGVFGVRTGRGKNQSVFARGEKHFDAPAKHGKSSPSSVFSPRKNLRADLPRCVSRRLR